MHLKGYSSREIELSRTFCSEVVIRSESIGEHSNAGTLYFEPKII